MSQRGDQSSQLSGLSGVSQLRSSSPQPNDINHSSNQEDHELGSAIANCEDTIVERARLQIIEDSLDHVANDSAILPQDVALKLRQVIQAEHAERYLKNAIDIGDGIQTQLLGITEIPKPELNSDEKRLIKAAVEREVEARCTKFIAKYEMLGGSVKELADASKSGIRDDLERINETMLSCWKEKLEEVCNEIQRDVVKLSELLEEWKKLKYEEVEEINVKKAKTKLLQSEIVEIQAKITKLSSCIKMFKETPTTIDAFKRVSHDLDERIANVEAEIKKKKILKTKYEQLKGTEYDDILKRYLDLCATIKKGERLLEML